MRAKYRLYRNGPKPWSSVCRRRPRLKVINRLDTKILHENTLSHIIHSVNILADMVHANAKRKGFHKKEPIEIFRLREWLNTICEVAELRESDRDNTLWEPCDKAEKMVAAGLPALYCIEEEYADQMIRILDQCRRQGVDIARAVIIKHLFNKTRPRLHGRKKG